MQSYCDFTSEAGKAWTLIESFSLLNKGIYIYHAFPRNENNFKLDDFRVSYQALVNMRDNSTHWRVTCTHAPRSMKRIFWHLSIKINARGMNTFQFAE